MRISYGDSVCPACPPVRHDPVRKAVVAGTAGTAMAVPIIRPTMWPKLTRNMRIKVLILMSKMFENSLTSTVISKKNFKGWYPRARTPLNKGGEKLSEGDGTERQGNEGKGGTWRVGEKGRDGEERRWEGNWKGKGAEAPPFHIYGYDTADSYSLSAVLSFFSFGVTLFMLHILARAWSYKRSFGSI